MTETFKKKSAMLLAVHTKWDAVTRHDNYGLLTQDNRYFELKDGKTLM